MVFLPLTLLTGWYGMNFVSMPELRWRYGYPAVIVLGAAIVGGLLYWFKRKKSGCRTCKKRRYVVGSCYKFDRLWTGELVRQAERKLRASTRDLMWVMPT